MPKDDKEAVKWFHKAAEQGETGAQFNLGLMYAKGEGVPKDDKEAVKWYRKAAEQGYASAQYNFAVMYRIGEGVLKDDKEAKKWFRKSAEQGLAQAQDVLGAKKKPLTKEESAKVIEAAIRKQLKKPTGELTRADLEKVTALYFYNNQLTDVKGLEKLTQLVGLGLNANKLTNVKGPEKLTRLTKLELEDNPSLTKAQIDELQKALPKCKINHNAKN